VRTIEIAISQNVKAMYVLRIQQLMIGTGTNVEYSTVVRRRAVERSSRGTVTKRFQLRSTYCDSRLHSSLKNMTGYIPKLYAPHRRKARVLQHDKYIAQSALAIRLEMT
jgi:hypothetical protein